VNRFGTKRAVASCAAPALIAWSLASPADASAAPDGAELEPVHLAYRASGSCPTIDSFEGEVRRAAPDFRVTDDEHARLFSIVLEDATPARGRLAITKDGEKLGAREVTGKDCEEAMALLAFAVALAVDPRALPPAATAPQAPHPEPKPPAAAPAPAHAGKPTPRETWWALSIHGFAASAFAPNATFGGGPAVDFGMRLGPLLPSLRVGFDYATSASVTVDAAPITFADVLAFVDACPTSLTLGPVAIRPCLRVDAGTRILTSADIPEAQVVYRPWLDVGAMVHVRVRLARGFFAEAGGGALFDAFQDDAFLSPAAEFPVHRVPPSGARGEVTVGVEFR
jgi:hypothetical protein